MKTSGLISVLLSAAAVVSAGDFPPTPNHSHNSCCKVFYKIQEGDTCDSLLAAHAPGKFYDFYSYNYVSKYCDDLKVGEWYCICRCPLELAQRDRS